MAKDLSLLKKRSSLVMSLIVCAIRDDAAALEMTR